MSKKRWLIVPLCAVLCSQGLFAQTLDRRVLGIDEMFRLGRREQSEYSNV